MTAAKQIKRARGRPAFEPTKVQRRRVSILAGGGMTHDGIAMALDISDETLRKYFAHELSVGAYERRAEVLEGLYKAAKRGNVSAVKAYAALAPYLAAPPVAPDKAGVPATEQQGVAKGKKEQAQDDAVTAQQGTDWDKLLPGPRAVQ